MLKNFGEYWENLEGDENGRHELIKLIVERGEREKDAVVKMTLKSNYHLELGHNAKGPTEIRWAPHYTRAGATGTAHTRV